MYSFLGKIEAKADNKGRLFVPAPYRKQLLQEGDSRWVIRKNDEFEHLDIYPESVWNEEVQLIASKLNLLDDEDNLFYMQYTSSADLLEMDANGRILIPKRYLDSVGIVSESLFVGTTKKIALWEKSNYEKRMKPASEFLKLKKEKLKSLN